MPVFHPFAPRPVRKVPYGSIRRIATYLRWIALGKTMEEIADVEGAKYNSVRVKLRETMKRFDVCPTPILPRWQSDENSFEG